MSTSCCPRCSGQVTLPVGLANDTLVRCPLCRARFSLADALVNMPPLLEVVEDDAPESEDDWLSESKATGSNKPPVDFFADFNKSEKSPEAAPHLPADEISFESDEITFESVEDAVAGDAAEEEIESIARDDLSLDLESEIAKGEFVDEADVMSVLGEPDAPADSDDVAAAAEAVEEWNPEELSASEPLNLEDSLGADEFVAEPAEAEELSLDFGAPSPPSSDTELDSFGESFSFDESPGKNAPLADFQSHVVEPGADAGEELAFEEPAFAAVAIPEAADETAGKGKKGKGKPAKVKPVKVKKERAPKDPAAAGKRSHVGTLLAVLLPALVAVPLAFYGALWFSPAYDIFGLNRMLPAALLPTANKQIARIPTMQQLPPSSAPEESSAAPPAEEAPATEPAGETPAAESAASTSEAKATTAEAPTTEEPAAPEETPPAGPEEPAAAAEEPAAATPTPEDTAEASPTVEEPAAEPAVEETAEMPAEPAIDNPLAAEPATEEPATDKPAEGDDPFAEPAAEEEAAAEEMPAEEVPAEAMPEEETPAEDAPAEDMPAEDAPAEESPVEEEAPAEEMPAEDSPAEEPATEEAAADAPAEETPSEEMPEEMPAEEAAATPSAPEEPAAELPAAEEPAAEVLPAQEPAAETPPAAKQPGTSEDVGPRDAKQFSSDDVSGAMQATIDAFQKLAAAESSGDEGQLRKARAGFYPNLFALAEAVTLVKRDPSDTALNGQLMALEQIAGQQLAADPKQLENLKTFGARWFSFPKRTTNGIVLVGTVEGVEHTGGLFLTKLKLGTAADAKVVTLASATDPKLVAADQALTLGTIIDKPAEALSGYEGTDPSVVWSGMTLKIAPE